MVLPVAVGCQLPSTPRTDPGVRHYRTGLLPRVVTRRHPKVPAVRDRAPVTGSTQLCVRLLVCWTTFPLARSLPSTSSAGPVGQPLFEGFLGTLKRSDSLHPCITVVPLRFTVRTWRSLVRPDTGPPGFRTPCFCACERSPTPPGPSTPHHNGVYGVAFRVLGARRHPGLADFGAQYSACTFPCQRFAPPVTESHA